MRMVSSILRCIAIVCSALLMLLFLYTEFLYLRESLFHFFNPFLHLQVLFSMLMTQVFWVLVIIAGASEWMSNKLEGSE